ncbi:MinD superfamily P-loop ATPase [Sedimentibacter acidaminivorans]|jgi:MinD superfamily P-loop ATPase|uniref:MinD superfamily P-loop ATPase n=1 Tax=Sedimentibacter acidaminivorans TaxID=913099 RepID=A0ABS4GED7_9FIRM|nr:ATP-binding protein [Sedimentibacter acidaminivorans]MBP1926054.1 MinD superfamily P-loop ATPase [Sedimentibacter acidaminivorans]
MKQLLILSGKGGTGKTTVASAFIKLSNARAYADCDVDAPNLHLVMKQQFQPRTKDYYGMPKAKINTDICISCDMCRKNCRFDAIKVNKRNNEYHVDNFACEGCGVCEEICPAEAISLETVVSGELMLYNDDIVFSTAKLKMGSGTSGMLVTEVKSQLKDVVKNTELTIIDGSPGIGCPVIASISGVDLVLIVSEPSISGISDMERIIETSNKFQTKTAVCINKYNTNIENSEKIIRYCQKNQIPFVGKIPYDSNAIKAINNGKSIIDIDCDAGDATKDVFNKIMKILN